MTSLPDLSLLSPPTIAIHTLTMIEVMSVKDGNSSKACLVRDYLEQGKEGRAWMLEREVYEFVLGVCRKRCNQEKKRVVICLWQIPTFAARK